jgi:hypothetical protein
VNRLVEDSEVTTVWRDGEVYRTDRFHRTRQRPNIAPIAEGACPVCWSRSCRAIPRDLSQPCQFCNDPARVARKTEEEIEL